MKINLKNEFKTTKKNINDLLMFIFEDVNVITSESQDAFITIINCYKKDSKLITDILKQYCNAYNIELRFTKFINNKDVLLLISSDEKILTENC
jgi:hypothetical protein